VSLPDSHIQREVWFLARMCLIEFQGGWSVGQLSPRIPMLSNGILAFWYRSHHWVEKSPLLRHQKVTQ
jgi:hypothetical protein